MVLYKSQKNKKTFKGEDKNGQKKNILYWN